MRSPRPCFSPKMENSSKGLLLLTWPDSNSQRCSGRNTKIGCLIRRAKYQLERKQNQGCLHITTITGTKCSSPGNSWHFLLCLKGSWRNRTRHCRRCCCVRFQILWKATISLSEILTIGDTLQVELLRQDFQPDMTISLKATICEQNDMGNDVW